MLIPRPETLRSLLARYNELQLAHSQDSAAALRRSLQDVSYTLCVTTGTRTIQDALLVAERILRTPQGHAVIVDAHEQRQVVEQAVTSGGALQPSAM
ncbi:DUF5133 domain-containing protein [Streptomyces rubiginosohelvolus]|uniref:DUF5133 domain-containing protein n=1 Tax=Streptomyces rubiginosohelvolus TaxID=67362 RepID=UPI0038102C33